MLVPGRVFVDLPLAPCAGYRPSRTSYRYVPKFSPAGGGHSANRCHDEVQTYDMRGGECSASSLCVCSPCFTTLTCTSCHGHQVNGQTMGFSTLCWIQFADTFLYSRSQPQPLVSLRVPRFGLNAREVRGSKISMMAGLQVSNEVCSECVSLDWLFDFRKDWVMRCPEQ